MKPTRIVLMLAGAALLCGMAYWWHSVHTADVQAAPTAPADPNALVATQPVGRQSLPLTLDAFGEVATAKPESLSFPQAGQLTALPVLLGQQVKRGDVMARLASDPNTVSAYEQAASGAAVARRELARQQELLGLQLATQTQVDAARKTLDDARAALAAATKLGGAGSGGVLRAPYDGVVVTLAAASGDRIAAGVTIVQVGRSDGARVLLALEPLRSAHVKPGMAVTLLPLLNGALPFEARIASVGDLVDPKSQMVTAIVALPRDGLRGLVPGTRLEATVRLGVRDAWAVPRLAVLSDDHGAYLFQVRAGKARRVAVTKVAEIGQLVGVDGNLDVTLPVVVQGNYELTEGMSVREGSRGIGQ